MEKGLRYLQCGIDLSQGITNFACYIHASSEGMQKDKQMKRSVSVLRDLAVSRRIANADLNRSSALPIRTLQVDLQQPLR